MGHIVILWFSLLFCIVLISIYITVQLYRKSDRRFLRLYSYYLTSVLFTIFTYIVLYYLGLNILGVSSYDEIPVIYVISSILAWVVISLNLYLIMICSDELLKLKETSGISKIILIIIIVGGLLHLSSMFVYLINASTINYSNTIKISYNFLAIALILLVTGRLISKAGKIKRNSERKALILFGYFYFIIYLLYPAITFIPRRFAVYYTFVIVFIQCIFPIIWLRRYYLKYYQMEELEDNLQVLDIISKKYNISVREAEIISLIARGMSNDEIMDELFISASTVRNHIYNIYKKIGINSRGQLLHLLIDMKYTG